MCIQNARITVFKHSFPHTLIINYGQILYEITLIPFKHTYHQDYEALNHAKVSI